MITYFMLFIFFIFLVKEVLIFPPWLNDSNGSSAAAGSGWTLHGGDSCADAGSFAEFQNLEGGSNENWKGRAGWNFWASWNFEMIWNDSKCIESVESFIFVGWPVVIQISNQILGVPRRFILQCWTNIFLGYPVLTYVEDKTGFPWPSYVLLLGSIRFCEVLQVTNVIATQKWSSKMDNLGQLIVFWKNTFEHYSNVWMITSQNGVQKWMISPNCRWQVEEALARGSNDNISCLVIFLWPVWPAAVFKDILLHRMPSSNKLLHTSMTRDYVVATCCYFKVLSF